MKEEISQKDAKIKQIQEDIKDSELNVIAWLQWVIKDNKETIVALEVDEEWITKEVNNLRSQRCLRSPHEDPESTLASLEDTLTTVKFTNWEIRKKYGQSEYSVNSFMTEMESIINEHSVALDLSEPRQRR